MTEDINANLQATLNQTATDMGLSDLAVTVGVVTPHLQWSGATGIANLTTQAATATDDLFNIGSISKAFTSATILKLQEQGKLSLDDTLGQWLPEIAANIPSSEHLTLRQILNGTAGIFDYVNSEEFLTDLATDYLSGGDTSRQVEELLAVFLDKPVADEWVYTNTGNLLAVIIAETATGQDFADILTEEILQPLGLENTFFTADEVDIERRANGYDDIFLSNGDLGEDGILEDFTSVSTTIAIGAGSMVSSAKDVAIFFDALASGELLEPNSTEEIFNYVVTGVPGLEQFGLGVYPDEYAWGNSRSMNGGIFGYTSYVDYFLRDDTTISVLLNRNDGKAALTAVAYKSALVNTLNLGNALFLEGTAGDDYLKETSGGDVVWGYAGNDTIFGYGGNDILDGGVGNDFLQGNQGDDLLFGQAGKDVLDGGAGDDFINGGNNSDRIFGGQGNDSIIGGKGKDTLNGEQGRDILDGGLGNDLIEDNQGNNVFYGGGDNDSLLAGSGDDLLYGEAGNDYLEAGAGSDRLIGGRGKDTLSGGAGVNEIAGGLGKDVFILSADGIAIINDFSRSQDSLEFAQKIDLEDLTIAQGKEENANDTVITWEDETVAILRNTNADTIAEDSFILPKQTSFNFNFADNVSTEAIEAMVKAGETWSNFLRDDITININVGFNSLSEFTAGDADSNIVEVSYGDFYNALSNDVTSADDEIATKYLPNEDSFPILINNTQENQGSDTPYVDDNSSENNSTIELTTANAKALGFDVATDWDGTIEFTEGINWDYDNSDGIAEDAIDFESVAVHEISHILGFISSVDYLDVIAGNNLKELITSEEITTEDILDFLGLEEAVSDLGLEEIIADLDLQDLITGNPLEPLLETIQPDTLLSENEYTPTSMDLFRFSDSSSDLGIIDFTTGESSKYFSLDGGQTEIAQLSTGVYLGNGAQISHWIQEEGIGIMKPGIGFDEIDSISHNDLQALDAIGWDINQS